MKHLPCDGVGYEYLIFILPSILQGLSFLLVFMTALEFICAQAPLRLKGLLIGLWYATLAVNCLLVGIPVIFISDSITLAVNWSGNTCNIHIRLHHMGGV